MNKKYQKKLIENKTTSQKLTLKGATQETIYFPNSRAPRWQLRVDQIENFWRILPANGLRGKLKKLFVKLLLPKIYFLLPSQISEMPNAHFIYLGVDDGKKTKLIININQNGVEIEKTCVDKEASIYLYREAEVLKKLRKAPSRNFPRFLSYEQGKLRYNGAFPKKGFDPKLGMHRTKLIDALADFYCHFPVRLIDDGTYMCVSHGDLNKWNMFIDSNDELHIFDFETACEAPLGFDLATSYVSEFDNHLFMRVLREDLAMLGAKLNCSEIRIDEQIQKILGMLQNGSVPHNGWSCGIEKAEWRSRSR